MCFKKKKMFLFIYKSFLIGKQEKQVDQTDIKFIVIAEEEGSIVKRYKAHTHTHGENGKIKGKPQSKKKGSATNAKTKSLNKTTTKIRFINSTFKSNIQ